MGKGSRRGLRVGVIAKRWREGVLYLTTLAIAPASLHSQQVDLATAEEVLVQALRYIIEVEFESKHLDPVLTGIRLRSTPKDTATLTSSELTQVVSSALGIRIQAFEENTFCDTDRNIPYLRSRDADLRIGATLTEVGDTAAYVSVNSIDGTLLSGSIGRTVELEWAGNRWVATGLGDVFMSGSFFSCRPPLPPLSPEELEDLVLKGIVNTLDLPTLGGPPRSIENLCVDHRLDVEAQEVVEAVREHLREKGIAIQEECVWRDEEQGGRQVTARTGEPAIWLQLRSVASEGEERIILQVGVWSGTGPPYCGRFPARPCVFNCSFERNALGWGTPLCELASFSVRRPSVTPDGASGSLRGVMGLSWGAS